MDHPPLTYKLVRGVRVDVLGEPIHYFLFRIEFIRLSIMKEFDYVGTRCKMLSRRHREYTYLEG